jgi:glycosyltransferase involved in cell wall biosynthesis
MAGTLVIVATAMRSGGSVGAVAWRHAQELSRSHKVYVVTRDIPDGEHAGIEPLLVRPRPWTWLRRFGHVPNELAFLRAARREIAGLAAREKIDVVWCHSHAAATLVGAPLKKRLGVRVIMTTHGDIFDRPPGTYSRDLTWFYKSVTPRAYREADLVHVLSPYMGECAVARGAPRERVRVIPNGIDASDIGLEAPAMRDAASFMPQGVLRLLYVGSFWNVKGIDVLLRAMAQLGQAPGMPVQVTLVGEGALAGELAGLAKSLAIADAVTFAGRIERHRLAAIYGKADVLCVPSRSEALPTVAMEAMLCSVPVVGSNTGGIPMLVEDGATGYLAAPGDPTSLAEGLRKAAASREHLAALGARGLAKLHRSFGWPEVARQLRGLANEALAPGPVDGGVR